MNGHQKVAYVPSDSALFLGTVSENIALSDTFDIKWVMECAKMANADGFIHEMPNGYDEQIVAQITVCPVVRHSVLRLREHIMQMPILSFSMNRHPISMPVPWNTFTGQ